MLAAGTCWPCMGELNILSAGYLRHSRIQIRLWDSGWSTWRVKAVFLLKLFCHNAGRFLCWSRCFIQGLTGGIHVPWLNCWPVAKAALLQVWRVARILLSPARWSGKAGTSASFLDLLLHWGTWVAVTPADVRESHLLPALLSWPLLSLGSGSKGDQPSHAVPGSRLFAAFPLSALCS